MKKTILLLITFFTLNSCNKDDNPFSGSDKLPPETQTGANTVGCLVNGKVFLPHAEGINPEVNCSYQYIDGQFYFIIAFRDLRGHSTEMVSVRANKINLQTGNTYTLDKNIIDNGDFTGGAGSYSPTLQNTYTTNSLKTGELKITRVDLSNSIISGTFWFDAVNQAGEVVEIREGRFDWNY
ncbi:DUF6252 family protein [Flavobacterium sp. PLA-1-15]|uniref:DUF6252 family protein n=1 Tax=Flavobacterium sp. PLA-1-15 TaxID=3380533 RepID=UPI003B817FFA